MSSSAEASTGQVLTFSQAATASRWGPSSSTGETKRPPFARRTTWVESKLECRAVGRSAFPPPSTSLALCTQSFTLARPWPSASARIRTRPRSSAIPSKRNSRPTPSPQSSATSTGASSIARSTPRWPSPLACRKRTVPATVAPGSNSSTTSARSSALAKVLASA